MSDYKIWTHKEQMLYKDFSIQPYINDEDGDIWWWCSANPEMEFAWLHEVLDYIEDLEV